MWVGDDCQMFEVFSFSESEKGIKLFLGKSVRLFKHKNESKGTHEKVYPKKKGSLLSLFYGELSSAFSTACLDNFLSRCRFHSHEKTMSGRSLALFWLIGSLWHTIRFITRALYRKMYFYQVLSYIQRQSRVHYCGGEVVQNTYTHFIPSCIFQFKNDSSIPTLSSKNIYSFFYPGIMQITTRFFYCHESYLSLFQLKQYRPDCSSRCKTIMG